MPKKKKKGWSFLPKKKNRWSFLPKFQKEQVLKAINFFTDREYGFYSCDGFFLYKSLEEYYR